MDSLADRVRFLLDVGAVKAREASRLAGYPSQSYVGMLARGHVRNPGVDSAARLAQTFGCSAGWLAFGSGTEPTTEQVRAAIERARGAQPPPIELDMPGTRRAKPKAVRPTKRAVGEN